MFCLLKKEKVLFGRQGHFQLSTDLRITVQAPNTIYLSSGTAYALTSIFGTSLF